MQERSNFIKRYKVKELAPAANLLMLPMYISYFVGLRDVLYFPEKHQIIEAAAFLWMPSGFLPDPYYIVPAITAIVSYMSIRKMMVNQPNTSSTPLLFRKIKSFTPLLPFFSFFFFASLPAGFNLYVFVIALTNFLNNYFFQSKFFGKIFGIPEAFPGTILFYELQQKRQNEIASSYKKVDEIKKGFRNERIANGTDTNSNSNKLESDEENISQSIYQKSKKQNNVNLNSSESDDSFKTIHNTKILGSKPPSKKNSKSFQIK